MSRNGDNKKPVGFATQLTAGGIAGAMEAVRVIHGLQIPQLIIVCYALAVLSTTGHD